MRGRHGRSGPLDFGTFRDLERLAVQFTSDLRKLAMQSSSAGENVITDLRSILEEALERIKSEIFGPPHAAPDAPGHDAPAQDVPAQDIPAQDATSQPTDSAEDSPTRD